MIHNCGQCTYASMLPKDFLKRGCRGAPPQIVVLPTPQGPQMQMMYPIVLATDEACGAFKQKVAPTIDTPKEV